ncbi:unnamed protein product [Rotaria sordida]|uniref:Uncharacterized protein n=1 Tax=Rotaria sordida TaxID=392033 RepID=A0A819T5N7_9BILA|nr:unnamed protein product [Rotaria sordida]CAF1518093.1 unnamed protein product [Rotaria sordida]CAF4073158.1 unnamed protein product [Rotaria sordida]CAF4135090.1 unnamed protein product [Rotaria sordida]
MEGINASIKLPPIDLPSQQRTVEIMRKTPPWQSSSILTNDPIEREKSSITVTNVQMQTTIEDGINSITAAIERLIALQTRQTSRTEIVEGTQQSFTTIQAKPKPFPRKKTVLPTYLPPIKAIECPTFKLCLEFVLSLKWRNSFFATQHNRCYCSICYLSNQPDVLIAGRANYVVPRGWAAFGLSVDPTLADCHDIWRTWIVTYHGTSTLAAESILKQRQFLIPGDTLIDGTRLAVRPGHIPGMEYVYTSPSIRYASLDMYSVRYNFRASSGQQYQAKIVLQCRQKPGTFKIQRETIGQGTRRICKFISNEQIEYLTNYRSSVVPYRLLVSLRPMGVPLRPYTTHRLTKFVPLPPI